MDARRESEPSPMKHVTVKRTSECELVVTRTFDAPARLFDQFARPARPSRVPSSRRPPRGARGSHLGIIKSLVRPSVEGESGLFSSWRSERRRRMVCRKRSLRVGTATGTDNLSMARL